MNYLIRIAAWLSQGVNCILLGGHHDMTVSARCYLNRRKFGWNVVYRTINKVFFWQYNHCYISYQSDVEFARKIFEQIKKCET